MTMTRVLAVLAVLASTVSGLLLHSQRQEARACPDVSGQYEDTKGMPLEVSQIGCEVGVKMFWEATDQEQIHKSGKVEGATLTIDSFKKAGRLTAQGDIFFGDGGHWRKKKQESAKLAKESAKPAKAPAAPTEVFTEAKTSEKPAIAESSTDTNRGKGCADIHGSYLDKRGHPLTVYQNGCFVKIKMSWDNTQGVVIMPGYIGWNDVHVKDFAAPGIFSENGDINFEDGGLWTKKLSDTALSTASHDQDESMTVQNDPVQGGMGQLASATAKADTAEWNPEVFENSDDCKDISGEYIDKKGMFVTIEQTACSVVIHDQIHDGAVAITGTVDEKLHLYNTESPGFVSTAGDIFFSDGAHWQLKTKGLKKAGNGTSTSENKNSNSSSTSEHADSHPSHIYGADGSASSDSSGDKETDDSTSWGSSGDKETDNSTSSDSSGDKDYDYDASNPVTQAEDPELNNTKDEYNAGVDAELEGNCPDISGLYTSKGHDVTVYQIGCFFKVKMFWDNDTGVVVKPGHMAEKGRQLVVKDFSEPGGIAENGDITFEDGGVWKKAEKADGQASTSAETNESGNSTAWPATATNYPQDRAVKANASDASSDTDAPIENGSANSSVQAWDASSADSAKTGMPCKDIHGLYLDKRGEKVTVTQTGCDVMVKVFWNEQKGDVQLPGSVVDGALQLEGAKSNGHLYSNTADIEFENGGHWTKQDAALDIDYGVVQDMAKDIVEQIISAVPKEPEAQETATSGLPSIPSGLPSIPNDYVETPNADCTDVHGKYLSIAGSQSDQPDSAGGAGQEVVIFQDGCMLKVQMVVDENAGEVELSGQIAGKDVHVEKFDGPASVTPLGDITFADGSSWKKSVEGTSAMTADAEAQGCGDVHGKYTSKEGQSVTIYQAGCFLKVKMLSQDADGFGFDVLKTGKLEGEVLRVKDFEHAALVNPNGDIVFAGGKTWSKAAASKPADNPALHPTPFTVAGATYPQGNYADESAVYADNSAEAVDASSFETQLEEFSPEEGKDDCSDIHGKYTSTQGHEINVYQVGCFLKVRMYWDEEQGEILKSGRIVGQDFRVQDFRKPGRVTLTGDVDVWGGHAGDIVFGDGHAWMKLQEATTADQESVVVEQVDNTAAMSNTAIVSVGLSNSTGNLSANASNMSVYALNASADDVDADEDLLVEQDCPEVSGIYETNATEVTVYQIGCFVKVKLYWNDTVGTVLKSGKLQGNFMYVKDMQMPGILTLSGDILFGNGGDWKRKGKKQTQEDDVNESSNASFNSSDNSSVNQTLMAHRDASGKLLDFDDDGQRGVLECADVSGHYYTSVGKLITLVQDVCNLAVQLWWDNEHGEVLTKGSISNTNYVHIDGFLEVGSLAEEASWGNSWGQIQFPAGAIWRKLSKEELENVKKDGCEDVDGYYGDRSGSIVDIVQTGCHAAVAVVRGSMSTKIKLGYVDSEELHLFDHTTPGRRMTDGSLDFGASAYWGKLSQEQAMEAANEQCAAVQGNYRDGRGDIATITQERCHINIQMLWDNETGNVTLGGYMFGDMVHVKEFHSMGAAETPGTIKFADGAIWHRMSDEEAEALSIPKAGCANYDGIFVDTNGKQVTVNQTGCHLQVSMWWNEQLGNVLVEGHVSRGTMHLRGLDDGERSQFGIYFGPSKHWTKIGAMTLIETSSKARTLDEPLAVRQQKPMKPYNFLDIRPLLR